MLSAMLGAILFLQPVLDEPVDLRLAAVGIGDETVTWHAGDVVLAESRDREVLTVGFGPGVGFFWVEGPDDESWRALARPLDDSGGAVHVDAWVARHDPVVKPNSPPTPGSPPIAAALGVAGAAVVFAAKLTRK